MCVKAPPASREGVSRQSRDMSTRPHRTLNELCLTGFLMVRVGDEDDGVVMTTLDIECVLYAWDPVSSLCSERGAAASPISQMRRQSHLRKPDSWQSLAV